MEPSGVSGLGSLRHHKMGSISLNLLGGNVKERIEPNSDLFIIQNNNVCCMKFMSESVTIKYYASLD